MGPKLTPDRPPPRKGDGILPYSLPIILNAPPNWGRDFPSREVVLPLMSRVKEDDLYPHAQGSLDSVVQTDQTSPYGTKRTFTLTALMSASDPKRTSRAPRVRSTRSNVFCRLVAISPPTLDHDVIQLPLEFSLPVGQGELTRVGA